MCEGSEIGEEYFYSVPSSMHALLLHGTLMDEMADIVNGLGASNPFFPVVFYLFLLISSLTVMNMLIGVLCEVVAAVAATEKEESSVAYVKWQIRDIMKKGGLDLDGDGMISKEEFVKILDNPQATRTLSNAGVDVFGLIDCADFIFGDDGAEDEGANEDAEPVQLSFADFMEVVLQLRGTNVATVKDLVDLRKFLTVTCKKLDEKVVRLTKDSERMNAWMVKMSKGISGLVADQASERESRRQASTLTTELVLPQETCESEALGVPQAHQVDVVSASVVSAPAAIIVPSVANAVASAGASAVANAVASAGAALKEGLFDQINGELDQLRQYVDTELTAIMQDLKVMSRQPDVRRYEPLHTTQSNLSVRLPSIDVSVPDLPQDSKADFKAQYDNEAIQVPESLSLRTGSSSMCPGAELRCLGADQRRQATCGL